MSPYQGASNAVSSMNCCEFRVAQRGYEKFQCIFPDCARDVKIFSDEGFQLPLSCSSNGNYALLQDLDGDTFCVDRDGFVVSPTFKTAIHEDECKKYVYYLL